MLDVEFTLICGTGSVGPLLDTDLKLAKNRFDTNYLSVLAMVQALPPSIIAAKGKIINIGSAAGEIILLYWGLSSMPLIVC